MKTIIMNSLLLAGAIMAIILLTVFVRPAPPTSGAAALDPGDSELSAGQGSYDFGTLSMAAGKVSYRFTVSNPTDQPITVNKVFTSCMCTKATLRNGSSQQGPFGMPGHGGAIPTIQEVIQPGVSAEVEAIYDPTAHGPAGVGKFARVVNVQTSDNKTLRLHIRGFVMP
jgi:hypothetical protein